jgi:hypothetical protein
MKIEVKAPHNGKPPAAYTPVARAVGVLPATVREHSGGPDD